MKLSGEERVGILIESDVHEAALKRRSIFHVNVKNNFPIQHATEKFINYQIHWSMYDVSRAEKELSLRGWREDGFASKSHIWIDG